MKFSISTLLILGIGLTVAAHHPDTCTERLKNFESQLTTMLEQDGPGLSIAITRDDQLMYEEYFGYAHLEKRVELDADHVLGIASMSKQFTGMGDGMNAVNMIFPSEDLSITVIRNVSTPKINSIQVALMALEHLLGKPED
jgi:hypothetical protein